MDHKQKQYDVNYEAINRKLIARSKNMVIHVDESDVLPILYLTIIGGIYTAEAYGHEIFTVLRGLVNDHPIIYLKIESPGGSLDTFDILESIFLSDDVKLLITETVSEAYSCGLLLWSLGDVRLTTRSASFMMHRESMYTKYGKTPEIKEDIHFFDDLYTKRFTEIFKKIGLTDEEINKTRYTEVWKAGEEFIRNGVAYPLNMFSIDNIVIKPHSIVRICGKAYLYDPEYDLFREIKHIEVNSDFMTYTDIVKNELSAHAKYYIYEDDGDDSKDDSDKKQYKRRYNRTPKMKSIRRKK